MNAQPQRDPMAPNSMPSVLEQLAMYSNRYIQEQKQLEQSQDPFESQYDKEDPAQQEQDLNLWLSPVTSDTSMPEANPNGADYNAFIDMFENDPVVQEHGEQMQEVLEQLRQAVQSGQIPYDQAMSMAVDLMNKHVAPSIDKHHGTNFTSRNILNPKVKDVAEAFGADVNDTPDGKRKTKPIEEAE